MNKSSAGWVAKPAPCRVDGAAAGVHSVRTRVPHLGTCSVPHRPALCSLLPQYEASHTCQVCSSSSCRASEEYYKKFWVKYVAYKTVRLAGS